MIERNGFVEAGATMRDAALYDVSLSDGVAVRDGFLSARRIHELIQCAEKRHARGDFAPARVGADRQLQRRPEIRGDFICWLAAPLFDAERTLLDELERLRLDLNRDSFLGLFEIELHYARYPPGSGYARHLDQLQGRDQRRVSFVLYLNPAWKPGHGGELRLFETADRHRDIEPVGGRLVYFPSAQQEHAVLPTCRDRLSVTGWFRGR